MIILIFLAYGSDTWREWSRLYYSRTFSHLFEFTLSYAAANLLLAAALVAWIWYILARAEVETWICGILVAAGLLITLLPIFYFTPLLSLYASARLSQSLQLTLTSGIIAMVGFFKLVLPRKIPGTG